MATTWASIGARSTKGTSTTGSETSAVLTASSGTLLDGVGGFSVHVEATGANTITTGGTLQAYIYQDYEAVWSRAPDLDLTVSATGVKAVGFIGFSVPSPRGRIAYLPNGMAVSGGASIDIDILCTSRADGSGGTFAN